MSTLDANVLQPKSKCIFPATPFLQALNLSQLKVATVSYLDSLFPVSPLSPAACVPDNPGDLSETQQITSLRASQTELKIPCPCMAMGIVLWDLPCPSCPLVTLLPLWLRWGWQQGHSCLRAFAQASLCVQCSFSETSN